MESRARSSRQQVDGALDWFFFLVGGASAVWLAGLVFWESFALGWWQIVFAVVFWVLLAYLVLPRLHRILTRVYVPGYFIGRARTSDGLLAAAVPLVFAVAEVWLAWRIFLGRNWARLLAMALSTIAIATQAGAVLAGGPGLTLQTNLPGLAFDILLLLALSSEHSLVYARRPRKAPKRIAARPGEVARL